MNSADSFSFSQVTDNYMGLRDILICIIRKKQITVSDVIDAFMLTHKLGQLEYMTIFYKKFKVLWKTQVKGTEDYENVDWLFYTLIDSEVSLKAGCMNEFLAGQIDVLKAYHSVMRFTTIRFFFLRILGIMSACDSSKDEKFVDMTEEMMLFVTASSKGGVMDKFEGEVKEYSEISHISITASKLDVLNDSKALSKQILEVVLDIVLHSERELAHKQKEMLIAYFAYFAASENISTYKKSLEEIARPIFKAKKKLEGNIFDHDIDNDTDGHFDWDEHYAQEEEEFVGYFEDLIDVSQKSRFNGNNKIYRVKFTNRVADNEMNLMDYYNEQGNLTKKRARVESAIQIFRKYRKYWLAFIKKESLVNQIRKERRMRAIQVPTSLENTNRNLNETVDYILAWITKEEEKIDKITQLNEKVTAEKKFKIIKKQKKMIDDVKRMYQALRGKIQSEFVKYIDYYNTSGFSRNVYYLLERLIQIVDTWEDYAAGVEKVVGELGLQLDETWEELIEEIYDRESNQTMYLRLNENIVKMLGRVAKLCNNITTLIQVLPTKEGLRGLFRITEVSSIYRGFLDSKYSFMHKGGRIQLINSYEIDSEVSSYNQVLRNMMAKYKTTRTLMNVAQTKNRYNAKISGFRQKNIFNSVEKNNDTGISLGLVNSLRQTIVAERAQRENEEAKIQAEITYEKELEEFTKKYQIEGDLRKFQEQQEKEKQDKIRKQQEEKQKMINQLGYYLPPSKM